MLFTTCNPIHVDETSKVLPSMFIILQHTSKSLETLDSDGEELNEFEEKDKCLKGLTEGNAKYNGLIIKVLEETKECAKVVITRDD